MIEIIIFTCTVGTFGGYYFIKKIIEKKKLKKMFLKKRFKLNKKNIKEFKLNNEICVICQDDYDINSNKKCYQLYCNHVFHKECLKEWLKNEMKCPLCNSSIMTKHNKTIEMLINEKYERRLREEIEINRMRRY